MNLEYLQYVVEVAEHKSISSASEHMYISQPYLSRVIRRIEEDFNLVLFVRTSKGISLTKEGEEFIDRSKLILSQYEDLKRIHRSGEDDSFSFSLTSVRSSLVMESFLSVMNRYHKDGRYEFYFNEAEG